MTSFLPSADGPNVNSKLYDNIYVSSSNSLTSAARVFTGQAAKLSLPSKSFSAQVQVINLPHNMLLGHTQLILKAPVSAVPAGAFLLEGWGYQALDYYEYVFSDSERLRIDSQQLLIKNMADVESGEKKSLVMALSQVKNTATALPVGGNYTSCISLYLPFSNLSSSRIHPFPSDILERPVQLTIAFKPWLSVLQYSIINAPTIQSNPLTQTGYTDAYLMCKTMYMLDPSDSIKEMVSLRGDSKYVYPYMYPQSFVSSTPIVGVSPSSAGGGPKMPVILTRFLNANLQSIDLFLLRTTLGNLIDTPTAGTPANAPMSRSVWNQNFFSQMINCRLSYAGQTIWQSDDNSDILMNLSEYPTSTTFDTNIYNYSEITNLPAVNPTFFPAKSKWLHIQLSQLNERFYSNISQCGPTLNSNEVLFEFNVLPLAEQEQFGNGPPAVQSNYTLYCVYNYSAAVRVARGAAHLVFQPELSVLPSISGIQGTY